MDARTEYYITKVKQRLILLQQAGYTVAGIFLQGSQNYNMEIHNADYNSDIDVSAWIVPKYEDLLYSRKPISKTLYVKDGMLLDAPQSEATVNLEHVNIRDIRTVPDLLMKSNPSAIELINSDYRVICPELQWIINERDTVSFINKTRLLKSIKGMMGRKKIDLRKPLPSQLELIDKYGYAPKQIHHHTRLMLVTSSIFTEGMTFKEALTPTGSDLETLLELKLGKWNDYLIDDLVKMNEDVVRTIDCEELFNRELLKRIETTVYDIVDDRIKKELGLMKPMTRLQRIKFRIAQLWIDVTHVLFLGRKQ